MITLEEFLEKFKNNSFSKASLVKFYQSVKKSVSLGFVNGRKAQHKLIEMNGKYQWPILKELDDPQLEIYKDAEDRSLLMKFIESINAQKRASNPQKTEILWKRAQKLYPAVFGFSNKDLKYCQKVGEIYDGIATGVVGAVGVEAYLVAKKIKEKKELKVKLLKGKLKRNKPA